MSYKRILVLANSAKKGGRCVAGREAALGDPLEIGKWLRPVSDAAEGELNPQHMTLKSGGQLKPLDVVDVPVKGHVGDQVHPEDWLVTGEPWLVVGQGSTAMLADLIEAPPSLWLEGRRPSDRVTTAFLQAMSNHQSLYIVRPQDFRLRYWREHNPYKGYVQKKTRAHFTYNGNSYDMSFTDIEATALYCKDFPKEDEPAKEVAFGDDCVICVSLTPALNGIHYKVVATLLLLP